MGGEQPHRHDVRGLDATALILGGFKKLNLDPANIKYIILTHGHGDHVNGAQYLQDTYKPRVILGGPDWTTLDNPNFRGPKPTRDIEGVDGQKVTLGDTTITLYLTPGHTAGTLSMLIPVKDGGRTHHSRALGRHRHAVQRCGVQQVGRPVPRHRHDRRRRRDSVDASTARQVGHQAADDGEAAAR